MILKMPKQNQLGTDVRSITVALVLALPLVTETYAQILDVLVNNIFKDYENTLRPYCTNGTATNVSLELALRQIIDLDAPKQLLELNVWVRLSWNDCRLTWNASDYNDIDEIVIPQNKVWIPDITLYDNAASVLPGINNYRADVSNDGTIKYNFPSVINSLCAIDVRYFPFDNQECNLVFGSWAYSGSSVDITNSSSETDLSNYVDNIEWTILRSPVITTRKYYGKEPFPTVTFRFELRRKPLFYVMNMVFPCLLITFVAVLGFLLPPDSGEKVNLEVTVLLSLAVFQLVVLDVIPASGESAPVISIYFLVSMILVALSCMMTVVVLQIHFKGRNGKEISKWIKRFVIRPLSCITCVKLKVKGHGTKNTDIEENYIGGIYRQKKELYVNGNRSLPLEERKSSEENINNKTYHGVHTTMSEVESHLKSINNTLTADMEQSSIQEEWSTLATILDRLFLMVYLTFTILVVFVLLLQFIANQ